jgi:hypothetical protein
VKEVVDGGERGSGRWGGGEWNDQLLVHYCGRKVE